MAFKFNVGDVVQANDMGSTVGTVRLRSEGRPNRYILEGGEGFGEDQLKLLSRDEAAKLPTKKWYHRGK